MTLFYIGAVALVLIGVFFALWPFIAANVFSKANLSRGIDRKEMNIELYQDHLKDLEQSLKQGNISQAQFEMLKQELERNLLEDSHLAGRSQTEEERKDTVSPAKKSSISLFYIASVLVLLPIATVGFYQWLGNASGWELQAQLKQQRVLEEQRVKAPASKSIENQLNQLNRQLVEDIESYLQSRPDDLDTRVLLARNAVSIGEYDKAIEAYQQIIEKQPQAAQMMAELAQVVFVKANNRAVPIVAMLAERALAIQPNNVMALGLMGIAEFQNGQYQSAINYWEKAIAIYPPNSPNARALQSGIVQARTRLIAQGEPGDGSKQPTKKEVGPGPLIKVAVSLGENVPFKPGDTVFVYARAWQGAKVPLAITRLSADQLPLTLELNDTMSMAPGMNLSSAEQVEVIARLSPSGSAIAQADDWQVSIGPLDPQAVSTTVYPLVVSEPLRLN